MAAQSQLVQLHLEHFRNCKQFCSSLLASFSARCSVALLFPTQSNRSQIGRIRPASCRCWRPDCSQQFCGTTSPNFVVFHLAPPTLSLVALSVPSTPAVVDGNISSGEIPITLYTRPGFGKSFSVCSCRR